MLQVDDLARLHLFSRDAAVFLFGLVVGSFLNVCIWRIPEGGQIVTGRSHCRACQQIVPWYDNIPLVSYLLLGGKCRFCKAKISWAYPAVELGTGLLFCAIVSRFGWTAVAASFALLGAALIVISVVDAREMIVPNEITWPGLVVGLILSFLAPALHGVQNPWKGVVASGLGILAGAGIIWGMAQVGKRLFRQKLMAIGEKEAMGEGDLWLMAMVGSFLGPIKVLLVNLFLAPFLGSIVGMIIKYRTKQDLIPYGPFLAAGTMFALFWGDAIMAWYRNLFSGGL